MNDAETTKPTVPKMEPLSSTSRTVVQDKKETPKPSGSPKSSGPSGPAKTITLPLNAALIVAGVAVALMIALYFGGLLSARSQGASELAAQKKQYDGQVSGLQADKQKAEADLAASQNLTHLMQARGSLYRTSLDLDQRNFGTANTHLQEAAVFLGEIKNNSGGIPTDQINALRSSISQTNINVAADLEGQRARVLDFASQLDAIIPAQEATPVAPSIP